MIFSQKTFPWHSEWPENVPKSINFDLKLPVEKIFENAQKYPDRIAILTSNYSLTYEVFAQKIKYFAASLDRYGIEKGDRVAIVLYNCPEFAIAFYSLLSIGAIAVLIDPTDTKATFKRKISDTEPKTLIIHDFIFKKHRDFLLEKNLILVSTKYYHFTLPWFDKLKYFVHFLWTVFTKPIRVLSYFDELIIAKETPKTEIKVHSNDTACILFSPGSHGIRFSHADLTVGAQQVIQWANFLPTDNFFTVFPLTKSFGISFCLNLPLMLGAKVTLLTNQNTKNVIKTIKKKKATIFIGTSGFYEEIFFNNQHQKKKFASLRLAFAIDYLPPKLRNTLLNLLPCPLIEGYALTETSTLQCCNPITKNYKDSIGLPLPNVEMKITDLKNYTIEMPKNQMGEIIINSPAVMKGYWNLTDTNRRLREGWLATGDVGKMGDKGEFYIYGKKKELINGIYSPFEIEEVLNNHPQIYESFVSKVQIENTALLVACVRSIEKQLDISEVLRWIAQFLPKEKLPQVIIRYEEFPRSEVGRVLREQLAIEILKAPELRSFISKRNLS